MEATFLAKRGLFNIPKLLSQGPPGIQSARKITRACFSSAFERAEGSNAVAETDDAPPMYETNPPFVTGEGRPPGSQASFGADTDKAVEAAENVGDSAKKTMDGAWRAAKDGAEVEVEDELEEDLAVDEIREVDQLVDTQEYRSIEELKKLD
ncbi:hypothetical protein V6N13_117615 [Hibiscus sabdariffa]|uniref:Late embryogenesis abundant protein n=1 Tax=Hibiscus sabdariffa TaxID=183260 RepID=A0ABR2PB48_9ROSI